ncbi:MAG: NAD(P)-dependent oxidoreductase [Alphaproteobacteria bacterium]
MTERVGFIGVGLMGHGMAKNILRKGWPLTVMAHRNRAPVEDLVAQGAAEAPTPRALAERSDVVMLCVTASPQVEAVLLGPGGVAEAARPGLLVVDCSTSDPASTRRLAAALAERGIEMADAPVTRGPKDSEAGRLLSLVGGSDAAFGRLRPILDCYSETVEHFGPCGAGHSAKIANNFITMGMSCLVTQTMTTAAAAGVDLDKLARVLLAGSACNVIMQRLMPAVTEGRLDGYQFEIANAMKDAALARDLAESVGTRIALNDAVHAVYAEAVAMGHGGDLIAHLFRAREEKHGLRIVGAGGPSPK